MQLQLVVQQGSSPAGYALPVPALPVPTLPPLPSPHRQAHHLRVGTAATLPPGLTRLHLGCLRDAAWLPQQVGVLEFAAQRGARRALARCSACGAGRAGAVAVTLPPHALPTPPPLWPRPRTWLACI